MNYFMNDVLERILEMGMTLKPPKRQVLEIMNLK
jgi:hypothetical protein